MPLKGVQTYRVKFYCLPQLFRIGVSGLFPCQVVSYLLQKYESFRFGGTPWITGKPNSKISSGIRFRDPNAHAPDHHAIFTVWVQNLLALAKCRPKNIILLTTPEPFGEN
jgi:hypothetical protein